jgi:hypothetical protein
MNTLITLYPVGESANDAGPQEAGVGVVFVFAVNCPK